MSTPSSAFLGAHRRTLAIALATVLGLALLVWILRRPGDAGAHAHTAHPHDGAHAVAAAVTWTCSMHPQIRQPDPGRCPLCGMDLIPAGAASDLPADPREIRLTPAAVALAEVATTPVVRAPAARTLRLVGRIEPAEGLVRTVSARFPGRIDFLRVDSTGAPIAAGEVMLELYAPEVLAAIAELRLPGSLAVARSAARAKLERWGFGPDDIDAFSRGVPPQTVPVRAPHTAIVLERMVAAGDYVAEGQPLFRTADLTTVWAQLEAYESDLPWLRYGQPVEVELATAPGRPRSGRITFVAPEFSPGRRTVPVRVSLANADLALRPGQWVSATVHAQLAADGSAAEPDLAGLWVSPRHPDMLAHAPGACPVCGTPMEPASRLTGEHPKPGSVLQVPVTAVLLTGTRSLVYVALPDREEPTFVGREVTLGPRAGDTYVVLAGLHEGEQVVTRGAFKIDASLQLQAQPSLMNPPAGTPARQPLLPGPAATLGEEERAALAMVADAVPALATALARADDAAALAAANALAHQASALPIAAFGDLRRTADALAQANDLAARRLALRPFMQALLQFEHTPDLSLPRPLWVIHCPMATDAGGADWLSLAPEVINPYWGEAMLRCGDVVRRFGAN